MSRINLGAKPYTTPQPVWIIATYDENGAADAMNAAWGGISESNEVSICLSPNHRTCKNFKKTGALTISMADAKHVAACDYVGIVSGDKVADKIAKAGLTVSKSEFVNAPIINELAVCVECKVKEFDEETCILKAEIVNVSVDESVLTDGKVDLAKVQPIAFDPFTNAYNVIGERVGAAWGAGKIFMQFKTSDSGALLACTGAVFIANNLILLIAPVTCWLYMTLFLINTEENWLQVQKVS